MKKHAKWLIVVAVVLMLMAMFAYVVTDEESLTPAPPSQQDAP